MEHVRLSYPQEPSTRSGAAYDRFRIYAYHDDHPRGSRYPDWPPHQVLSLSHEEATAFASYVAEHATAAGRVALAAAILNELSNAEFGKALRDSVNGKKK